MKISLRIKSDTDNSFPEADLIIESCNNMVFLTVSDAGREISVGLDELIGTLNLLKGMK